jgi:hypothetical protein
MKITPIFSRLVGWIALLSFTGTSLVPFPQLAIACTEASTSSPPPALAALTEPWTPPAPVYSTPARPAPPRPLRSVARPTALPAEPSAEDLRTYRAFRRPVVPAGREANPAERRALSATLAAIRQSQAGRGPEGMELLREYLREHHSSPLALSVWLEVAARAESDADFALALEASRQAWALGREVAPGGEGAEEAEYALARFTRLLMRLGQKPALQTLLAEVASRPADAHSSATMAQARAALAQWIRDPEMAALCGLTAYNTLAPHLGETPLRLPKRNLTAQPPGPPRARQTELATRGYTASRLAARLAEDGRVWRWVKRVAGEAIPAPCIVHWPFAAGSGHYSAAVESDAAATLVVDGALGLNRRLSNTVLLPQLSPFFLVPSASALPEGFVLAQAAEMATVAGRYTSLPGRE